MKSDDIADETYTASDLAKELGRRLLSGKLLISTAESCTGGLIAGAITEVPGSSAWFERSVVTYSNAAKQQMLGVDEAILSAHGAVSEACVKAMAHGALANADAQVAISVSGIAGPDGGTPEKPVGTVWIGRAWAGETAIDAECFIFQGNRWQVRQQAVCEALRGTISGLVKRGL
ncbi:CinA family protein [Granulosicoccus sp.]|nr:CinA family protein [Granulosicoccus sp.]